MPVRNRRLEKRNMEKKVALFAVAVMIMVSGGILAMDRIQKNESEPEQEEYSSEYSTNIGSEKIDSGKVLVAYFSNPIESSEVKTSVTNEDGETIGNTRAVAERIAASFKGASTFEIKTRTEYPKDYDELYKQALEEKEKSARPELAESVTDFSSYQTIFIGYPIWHGDMPMAIYSFLEAYDFSGKTVIPFSTSESTDPKGTFETLKSKLSKATVETDGLWVKAGEMAQADDAAVNWLVRLNRI